jgi:hypothetical protein
MWLTSFRLRTPNTDSCEPGNLSFHRHPSVLVTPSGLPPPRGQPDAWDKLRVPQPISPAIGCQAPLCSTRPGGWAPTWPPRFNPGVEIMAAVSTGGPRPFRTAEPPPAAPVRIIAN